MKNRALRSSGDEGFDKLSVLNKTQNSKLDIDGPVSSDLNNATAVSSFANKLEPSFEKALLEWQQSYNDALFAKQNDFLSPRMNSEQKFSPTGNHF